MVFFKKKDSGDDPLPVPIQEVRRLKSQNMTNSQIVQYLQNEGYKSNEIFKSLKEAERSPDQADYRELSDAPSDNLFNSLPKVPSDFNVETDDGLGFIPNEPEVKKNPVNPNLKRETPNRDFPPPRNDNIEKHFAPSPRREVNPDMSKYGSFNSDYIGSDIEKMEEIAESIIDEKWKDFMESVQKIVRWKEKTEQKITIVESRFEDIKKSFDSLQAAISKKMDNYDKSVSEVNTGVRAMEQVFQKVLPKLTDNVNELSRITKKADDKKHHKKD